MNLPSELEQAIENALRGKNLSALADASQQLSDQYRHRENNQKSLCVPTSSALAYIAARMPATYAAVSGVLNNLCKDCLNLPLKVC